MTNYYEISFIRPIVRTLICDTLKTNGRDTFVYSTSNVFTLLEDYPDSSTIRVYKNGTILSTGWSYNSATNQVTVTASLSTDDVILITYSYYGKYSDTEITNYIETSFAYFNQYRYRKTFILNSGRDEVHAINGDFPSVEEAYQIAIITAIVIDPKNVSIRTKEFTISAEENKGKFELIAEAFANFTNFLGNMSFDEDLSKDI